ncbi:MAG TPA: hypothetical protein VGN06_04380, partial [Gaiellaceae bacterium]
MRRRGTLCLIAAASLLAGCGGSSSRPLAAGLPAVVVSSPEAPGWVRLLRSAGYAAHTGDLAALLGRASGVVPGDVSLSRSDRSRVVHWVARGGRLATANDELLHDLGIDRSGPTSGAAVAMQGLRQPAEWAAPLVVRPLVGSKLIPLARLVPGRGIVMAGAPSGSGRVVAFAVDPLGGGRAGYELLPEDASLVGAWLRAPPGPTARGAEIFVDPGGLRSGLASDPTRIAGALAAAGARVAEIAGWNYDFND